MTCHRWIAPLAVLAAAFAPAVVAAQNTFARDASTGRLVYQRACAACHGADGTGMPQPVVGFAVPLPDFTSCTFTSREPDPDWLAIVHEGGPARGFDRLMPAFRDALSEAQMLDALARVRGFCRDLGAWPPGDLNLPRSLATEKAFPEDEVVLTLTADAEGAGGVAAKFVYERRVGRVDQFEVVLPYAASRSASGDWSGGAGDIALGWKRAIVHSPRTMTALSVAGEVILPTGSEALGTGKGVAVFEPFVAFGQAFAGESFVQFQGGLEIPVRSGHATEGFWRTVVGRTFSQDRFGRAWTPMLELLAARELASGHRTQWDLLPEVQVSLSRRQHILIAAGVRIPVTEAAARPTRVMVYLLWDWFDGGLLDGW
ncbi:MAG: cytochrome c [Acidobacteriota bacterium]